MRIRDYPAMVMANYMFGGTDSARVCRAHPR